MWSFVKEEYKMKVGSLEDAEKAMNAGVDAIIIQAKNAGGHVLGQIETRTLEEVKEVLHYASQNGTSVTRIMLDNMVVPLPNGDVDVSMLMINGRFETEDVEGKIRTLAQQQRKSVVCIISAFGSLSCATLSPFLPAKQWKKSVTKEVSQA